MSVIIDTTRTEIEAVIRYARIGANNCMIANSWEVTDLVRCKDCKFWEQATEESGRCIEELYTTAYSTDFCSYGERKTNETD